MDPFHYISILIAKLHGGVVEQKEICVNGKSAQVYYVNDESWGSAGQGLSFTHIILNRAHLEDKPDFVHNFIFLHEFGHKQWRWPLQIFFDIAQISYIITLFVFVRSSPVFALEAVAQPTIGSSLAYLVGCALIIVVPLTITWFDEGYAETYAISKIGYSTYLEIQKISEKTSRTVLERLRSRVMYPPEALILAAYRYRNNGIETDT